MKTVHKQAIGIVVALVVVVIYSSYESNPTEEIAVPTPVVIDSDDTIGGTSDLDYGIKEIEAAEVVGVFRKNDTTIFYYMRGHRNSRVIPLDPTKSIDIPTFEFVSSGIYKDKDHVYIPDYDQEKKTYSTGIINSSIGIDVPTFDFVGGKFYADKNDVYISYYDSEKYISVLYAVDLPQGIDAITIEHINRVFYKDKNNIYTVHSGYGGSTYSIEVFNVVGGIDVPTFEYLSRNYYKDRKHVYISEGSYNEIPALRIAEYDANSFQLLPLKYSEDSY